MTVDIKALWQNPPNDAQAALQAMDVSPLFAKYNTSVDTVPAARITYVNT